MTINRHPHFWFVVIFSIALVIVASVEVTNPVARVFFYLFAAGITIADYYATKPKNNGSN